jgi:O-acetyl-ADP-ribose deacetylase (regulator of RNase III)
MLNYVHHDLFESPAQTLVNAVNTVGVMGKGIAAEFKRRYPEMFERYQEHCRRGELQVGRLYLYRTANKWVLNFPTKQDWRAPSQIEWIEAGLAKFVAEYEERGITSASFPQLGCGNGGLEWARVKPLLERYLKPLPIPIFIHIRIDSSKFVPEHVGSGSRRRDRIDTDSLKAPPQHVSFAQFLADFFRLIGKDTQVDLRAPVDAVEPPVLPEVEVHTGERRLLVRGELLQSIWHKLVMRGALHSNSLPGFNPADSRALAELLQQLTYIASIDFVGGSFESPQIEPGIRYAPPAGQANLNLLIPRLETRVG